MILNNESYEAQKILERCSLSQRNRVIWESHFLIGCSHLSNGNFEQANQAFQKADEQARRQGKKTIDSLLIGRSFVAYKFNKKEEAIRYMKEANQINPYRVSVSRYLQKWQKRS